MVCEIDTHPEMDPDDTFLMQSYDGNSEDTWEDHGDTILADDVIIGHQYRCVFRPDGGSDVMSSYLNIVAGEITYVNK